MANRTHPHPSLTATTDFVSYVLIPSTAVVGLLSNALTCLVVTKIGLKTPSLVYMVLVALADSLSIVSELVNRLVDSFVVLIAEEIGITQLGLSWKYGK